MNAVLTPVSVAAKAAPFPMNRWWVAGFSWELTDKPLARTFLNRPMVLFRTPEGGVAALEDRCCHKELPLSCGTVEERGLRCGYHGLLFNGAGTCIEIPGQERIPPKARVQSYPLREKDKILWVWIGSTPDAQPQDEPPSYRFHSDPAYQYAGDIVHYEAPYQLIHDNLLDLSHLGYVHLKTIGGNPSIHMNAQLKVTSEGNAVRVVRLMPDSVPPPTYTSAWPFKGRIDRWQEVEFQVSHLLIWTGAMDAGSGSYDDPDRQGFHMRGFHGVTPETETTAHYLWSMATNPHPEMENPTSKVIEQTAMTFLEDKTVIEAQWQNQERFPQRSQVDIHVDVGPNRARRVIDNLVRQSSAA
jgi:phenylpropionate dioxygenase-like ring-hydroxylating dioxygenase large terminal subunit